jgi:3alpha(or 20beta)-hydroxysteroid dehydrogenase
VSGRLEGKVALVSGGARGMGAAHVRGLAAEGANVVIGDVLDEQGAAIASQVGDTALFVALDVTSESSWREAVDATEEAFGGLDVVINNAGVADGEINGIVEMSLDQYLRVVNVNQVGVFLGMHTTALAIAQRGGGSIINISSVAGLMGSPGSVNYTASKWAVRGMTKCAAIEFAPFNIRVNSVHPGFIRTPMLSVPEGIDMDALMAASVPLRRVADPTEVTRLVAFLASDESSYCTGAEFVVDGGLSSGVPQGALEVTVTEQFKARLARHPAAV